MIMDQNIQQQINGLFDEEKENKDETEVFLDEDDSSNSSSAASITPATKNEENISSSKTDEKKQDPKEDARPLYERFLNDNNQLETKKEAILKKYNEQKNILYAGLSAQNIDNSRPTNSSLNIFPAGKEDELKEKMHVMELGRKEEEIKEKALSISIGYINLKGLPIMPEALRLITEEKAQELGLICFYYVERKEIRVAILSNKISNPRINQFLKILSADYDNIELKLYLVSEASMAHAMRMYKALPKIAKQADDVKILEKDIESGIDELASLDEFGEKCKKANATEILSLIVSTAIKTESSDVHIESENSGIQLRFRIDGILHNIAKLEKNVWDKLISRIKLDSKLKINIKDKPQDGNFSVRIGGKEFDFRVSTLPTTYGESVVIRILYHEKVKNFTLEKLGIEDYAEKILLAELKKPNGMIIITGPTGSGKTTTLYAILNKLNTESNKIITIEDPIEYKIQGINQSEVSKERGYTFAKGLRSIVRQDPDIILVGEIRDKETTDIALNAALTGHLVFSTIHTNNAVGVIPRFLALAAKPYLLAPAINISIAQRLVRRICPDCKQKIEITIDDRERMVREIGMIPDNLKHKFNIDLKTAELYKGVGCKKCSGFGYKGQLGVFEIFQITDEIREIILSSNISESKLMAIAVQNGMVTMIQDGILKALKGITSLDEVFRVV
ncbi:hypothetical protein COV56_01295 [Candidatus Kuenenbacteria bacterium CG11_big_fil_rev_8_21_14_0_20_37_9]|uniref:Bacterial type II secretion system protein E domain-containing protein n=1 Tax=Candidatus Kuenenbacteria bacterium CG08_land_8_20_14_0_20_37_23 TaxID=1974617 RepID=A0A2M6XSY8_9BACT|nr:MAG: hypothetical protein COV56_01295 [Candidatus Kuenenbacteria bacterium CG11_big_fil_rev_8_21_14_0_20_37_9]PIU10689.1 MAG: hypothetical protein COT27_01795 [Candidatus Kuenenbacteria bacterium CG08_land_8_20_14_0_20_37_23]